MVVGTRTATCLPACTDLKAARNATSVFPYPTSPTSSRSIGRARSMSRFTSFEARRWSGVSSYRKADSSSRRHGDTPDQRRASEEVKRDMERARPMDRLLVGDVGYGKTEVALRAAFKSVQAGKQVAVLVPTTILAEQHGRTFRERLADYPVRIEVLSRFRGPKDTKQVTRQLETGEVDVVIGTHRLLSRDVGFHDLGLLIVDEEHRFGVRHKERLKALKLAVDVLTLTATRS